MIIANPRGELNPLLTVGEQIGNVLALSHSGSTAKPLRERRHRDAEGGPHPGPRAALRRLAARALGRHGAARRHRDRARSARPRFVISDDATSGLDVTVQAQILELLQRLVARHRTAMLFITRDIGITAHFCDRVAVIYAGEIIELAPRDAFFANPHHPYTVLLLAAFSHNPRLRGYWHRQGTSAGETRPRRGGLPLRRPAACGRRTVAAPSRRTTRAARPATSSAATSRWSAEPWRCSRSGTSSSTSRSRARRRWSRP